MSTGREVLLVVAEAAPADRRDATTQHTEHLVRLPVELGRDPVEGGVTIPDRMVSRHHARLETEGHRVVLVDLGSANGTWVGGERVERRSLRADDVITLGEHAVYWAPVSTTTVRARRVVEEGEAAGPDDLDGFLSFAHGFLPSTPPPAALPPSHRAWDDLAARLPELFTTLGMRSEIDRLPALDAGPAALPDRFLYRASTVLGLLAHAYWYAEIDPPPALPPGVETPWREVSRRLGKDVPYVSYVDLFLANWRLRDPDGPRRLANLDLLVATWGNAAEQVFYLVTTEFAAELAPVLGAMVRAQEAVAAADRAALVTELRAILAVFRHLTRTIYPQIDPNPTSTVHCDQVLWAKTVGIAGVPIMDGAASPAGTAQPQFHAMDAFFGRGRYDTTVGQQSLQLREQFPRRWAEVVGALAEISVADFVRESGDDELAGLWGTVLDAYAGDHGWMGLHRIKAYGFLEVAFTVGRSVTTGAKFTGLFRDKTWEKIDAELAEVRDERWSAGNALVVHGRPVPGGSAGATTGVVEIDVSGQGVWFEPGDRLGVLPENDDDLVRRTLAALHATGDEIVVLTRDWREAVAARPGRGVDRSATTEALPLRTVLRYGRIRPLTREIARRLVALSGNGALRRIVAARMEDQWELWDALGLLATGGFDVRRLWTAGPDDPDSICRVVPPEVFRLYSLASAPGPDGRADRIRLVVGSLTYASPRTTYSYPRERRGSASWFLRRMTEPRHRRHDLAMTVVPTPRFRLPDDPARPVLMVAAGSGIAPFLGFCAARAREPRCGPTVLVLGLRTPDDLVLQGELDGYAAAGALELHVAFSRRDARLRFDPGAGRHVVEAGPPGSARRLDALLAEPEQARRLAAVVGPLERGGGHLYVCGRADVAAAVMRTVRAAVAAHGAGSGGPDGETPDLVVRRLIAENRYAMDVFTTYGGHAGTGEPVDVSTLVERNGDDGPWWMAISGAVHDMTEFAHQHLGGVAIIRGHLGTDGTAAYRGVLHHERPEVDALLGTVEVGPMRRLAFGTRWAVVLGESTLRVLALEELFTAWVRAIYLVVEMENALANDDGFVDTAPTRATVPGTLTPYTAQFVVETHRRFSLSYLDGLLDEELRVLAGLTTAFCAPQRDLGWFAAGVADLRAAPEHGVGRRSIAAAAEGVGRGPGESLAAPTCRFWAAEDRRVLRAVKAALRAGILAFEQYEAAVVDRAGDTLMAALAGTVAAVADHDRRLADHARAHGLARTADDPEAAAADARVAAVAGDRGVPGHGGPPL